MSIQQDPVSCGIPSGADVAKKSPEWSTMSNADDMTTDAMAIDTNPFTTGAIHGMPHAAATTTSTITATRPSDEPASAGTANIQPVQRRLGLSQLTAVMASLDLHGTFMSGHESGYEADGERKPRSQRYKKRVVRKKLRRREKRRLGKEAKERALRRVSSAVSFKQVQRIPVRIYSASV